MHGRYTYHTVEEISLVHTLMPIAQMHMNQRREAEQEFFWTMFAVVILTTIESQKWISFSSTESKYVV